jgi:hypothetical protein
MTLLIWYKAFFREAMIRVFKSLIVFVFHFDDFLIVIRLKIENHVFFASDLG